MWAFVLFAIMGVVIGGLVALKPKLFWPALGFVAVGTAGFMVRGFTFIDEYLIGCILIGGFLAISIEAITLRKRQGDIWHFLHKWLFYFLIIYMIGQSVRGILVWESLQKIRWVVYYGMLGIVSFLISNKVFPSVKSKKLSLIISISALAYLILYLAHGFFTEVFRGMSRFAVQPGEWSTTAYALFPLVIAIPTSIFLIKEKNRFYKWSGWATFITAILAAFYYFSRVSWLVIFAFLFVSLKKLGIRKVVLLSLLFLLIFSLYFSIGSKAMLFERAGGFLGELSRTSQSIRFWETSTRSDIDRKIHLQVGFISITKDWKNFLFGYGFRTHGLVISPHLKRLYKAQGLPEIAAGVKDDQSTEGFTALLVDTGVVGMLLLSMNFLFVGRKIIINKKNPYRVILLTSLVFTFLWLPVINMVDIILFYLLIMPNGLLTQLSQYQRNEKI